MRPGNRRFTWLVVLALVLLILVASRAAAARNGVRYANARTGDPSCSNDDDREGSDEEAASDDDDGCRGSAEAAEAAEANDDGKGLRPDGAGGLDDSDLGTADAPDPDGVFSEDGAWSDDDDPLTRDAIETGVTFASTAFVDAAELRDVQLRHHRPSRWGRVDFELAWRRAWDMTPMKSTRDDTLWLVATWSR